MQDRSQKPFFCDVDMARHHLRARIATCMAQVTASPFCICTVTVRALRAPSNPFWGGSWLNSEIQSCAGMATFLSCHFTAVPGNANDGITADVFTVLPQHRCRMKTLTLYNSAFQFWSIFSCQQSTIKIDGHLPSPSQQRYSPAEGAPVLIVLVVRTFHIQSVYTPGDVFSGISRRWTPNETAAEWSAQGDIDFFEVESDNMSDAYKQPHLQQSLTRSMLYHIPLLTL